MRVDTTKLDGYRKLRDKFGSLSASEVRESFFHGSLAHLFRAALDYGDHCIFSTCLYHRHPVAGKRFRRHLRCGRHPQHVEAKRFKARRVVELYEGVRYPILHQIILVNMLNFLDQCLHACFGGTVQAPPFVVQRKKLPLNDSLSLQPLKVGIARHWVQHFSRNPLGRIGHCNPAIVGQYQALTFVGLLFCSCINPCAQLLSFIQISHLICMCKHTEGFVLQLFLNYPRHDIRRYRLCRCFQNCEINRVRVLLHLIC
mmetsp:Transcript_35252/g.56638  ORF Transcript_35252/g.56638 Transcript_35252/m.56638 type:complete len:257 (-) Transcript_35252:1165-1935(-)